MSQKQLKTVLLSVVVIAVILLGVFGLGSSSFFAASEQRDAAMSAALVDGQTVDTHLPVTEAETDAKTETEIESETVQQDAKSQTATKPVTDAKDGKETAAETDTDNKKSSGTAPVTDNTAAVPEQTAQPATENNCTISISCAALVKQLDLCDPDKKELVPSQQFLFRKAKQSLMCCSVFAKPIKYTWSMKIHRATTVPILKGLPICMSLTQAPNRAGCTKSMTGFPIMAAASTLCKMAM